MNHELTLRELVGSFAANGTMGDQLRIDKIEPLWKESEKIILNFEGVSSMTDSFANAFIGNIVERHPEDFRAKLRFINCSPLVKSFIKGALQYAQSRLAQA
ncbi:STAS-like domain-containing protein [Rubritalea tangerina]|uniref:STAS-like domain-containing protein n=1 Tax=Rubritalea tangerina TaxID=430798 RepID=A0ABW4ZCX2_9BACT